jgi:uncharacterized membrane protein YhaH (DUF805 family)
MNCYIDAWKKYAIFTGRTTRKDFWLFVLFNFIFGLIAMVLDMLFGINISIDNLVMPYGVIYILYSLIMLLPSLAICVRRLHDINKSGGWIFISLIPIIGAIWLLIMLCLKSDEVENSYGGCRTGEDAAT